ncbi:DUF397 domain-containing protein [Streptomyces sp. NPDC005897]|uniref:DUF397 domain-containing protein n=1 Tax=Streptomyces sp. NPDC005897 TaxID=3157081 RepID=UPI0033EE1A3A
MPTPIQWRKSSYSGGGEGNDCVEIGLDHPHIAVRDSKAPARAVLTFPAPAFSAFLGALRNPPRGLRASA